MTRSSRAHDLERLRAQAQAVYDRSHEQSYLNERGQFATSFPLAQAIAEDLLSRVGNDASLIEPACGTGAFLSALRSLGHSGNVLAVEKCPELWGIADGLWSQEGVSVRCGDFFSLALEERGRFSALIANPPYSRHHHLSRLEKETYSITTQLLSGVRLSSLAGLHAYFLLAGTAMLKEGGVASWLVPSELLSVNYGEVIRGYLTGPARVERVHLFSSEALQFANALVSSCVIVVRNVAANPDDVVEVTFGSFDRPAKTLRKTIAELRNLKKWQHLDETCRESEGIAIGDIFRSRRGIATGGNGYFVRSLSEWAQAEIERPWLTPVLPPPRRYRGLIVETDSEGWPADSDYALLSIPKDAALDELPESVRAYLSQCPEKVRQGYICTHRTPWYAVETCKAAPILCTYMGRSASSPFRFIRNRSKAIATNSYLGLYPRNSLGEGQLDALCAAMCAIDAKDLVAGGREYGGGLKKLEPKELMGIRIPFANLQRSCA